MISDEDSYLLHLFPCNNGMQQNHQDISNLQQAESIIQFFSLKECISQTKIVSIPSQTSPV